MAVSPNLLNFFKLKRKDIEAACTVKKQNFGATNLWYIKLGIHTFDLLTSDLPTFDLPTFDLPTFDLLYFTSISTVDQMSCFSNVLPTFDLLMFEFPI